MSLCWNSTLHSFISATNVLRDRMGKQCHRPLETNVYSRSGLMSVLMTNLSTWLYCSIILMMGRGPNETHCSGLEGSTYWISEKNNKKGGSEHQAVWSRYCLGDVFILCHNTCGTRTRFFSYRLISQVTTVTGLISVSLRIDSASWHYYQEYKVTFTESKSWWSSILVIWTTLKWI